MDCRECKPGGEDLDVKHLSRGVGRRHHPVRSAFGRRRCATACAAPQWRRTNEELLAQEEQESDGLFGRRGIPESGDKLVKRPEQDGDYRRVISFYRSARRTGLPVQEARLVTHLRSGLTPKEAATRMRISPNTGETYVRRARQRVGARTTIRLIADICENCL